MSNYALIKDGKVINTIVWDGPEKSPMDFGDDVTYVEIKEGVSVSTGYSYVDGKFIAPPLTEEEKAEIISNALASNINSKEYLMSEASQKISVLQDAVDLEMATDKEAASLPLWKKYRVLLSRVDANTADPITWPDIPSS